MERTKEIGRYVLTVDDNEDGISITHKDLDDWLVRLGRFNTDKFDEVKTLDDVRKNSNFELQSTWNPVCFFNVWIREAEKRVRMKAEKKDS